MSEQFSECIGSFMRLKGAHMVAPIPATPRVRNSHGQGCDFLGFCVLCKVGFQLPVQGLREV
jgi:hypothetical protein